MLDDQQRLINGLKDGDKKVFEEIYRLYYSPLCFYCLRYVGDMEEAKELVQGLFLKVWLKRKSIEINTSLKSYLYRAVQNYALNYLQQQKIKQKYVNHFQQAHSSISALRRTLRLKIKTLDILVLMLTRSPPIGRPVAGKTPRQHNIRPRAVGGGI